MLQDSTTFSWLIDSTVDTTVSATDCAYDRAITTGGFRTTTSAAVVRFDSELNLTPELTADVSDHYPMYFWLGLALVIDTHFSSSIPPPLLSPPRHSVYSACPRSMLHRLLRECVIHSRQTNKCLLPKASAKVSPIRPSKARSRARSDLVLNLTNHAVP